MGSLVWHGEEDMVNRHLNDHPTHATAGTAKDEHKAKNEREPGFYPALLAIGDGLKMLLIPRPQKTHPKVSSKASSPTTTLFHAEQEVTSAALRASSPEQAGQVYLQSSLCPCPHLRSCTSVRVSTRGDTHSHPPHTHTHTVRVPIQQLPGS